MMSGRIWIEGEVGRGSTFRFTARFGVTGAEKAPGARPRPEPDGRAPRPRGQRQSHQSPNPGGGPPKLGHRPAIVEDGPTALIALRRASDAGDPFAVALIDHMMPDMDGLELTDRIRAEPGLKESILVILTSSGLACEIEPDPGKGIDAFLAKPIRQAQLRGVLTRLIEARTPDIARRTGDLPPDRASSPDRGIKTSTGRRILLAEDHVINQKVAVSMLHRLGFEPTVVPDGRKALEAWEVGTFDLILMDIQMPEMDGFEALMAIRAREHEIGGRVPIVALTAHAMKGDLERCLEAGFDDYLAKPIRSDRLDEVIKKWTSRNPEEPGKLTEIALEISLIGVGRDEQPL